MLHIILGILTILLTILKWLGILLLILLLLAVALVLIVLFVPVRYRGRGEKTAEKLGAELSVTWLLHLIVVEAVFDAEGGSLKIRIFGRTPEEWRALLDKVKRKKRKKRKAKSLEAGGKKQKSTAKGAKRIPEEPPVKTGQSRQNSGEKPETSPDINSAEMDLFKPVKIQMSGQSFADERTDKQLQNPKETQESCQGEKTEGYQEQKQAGRLSKLLARIRGVLSDLPQKVLQVFRRLKRIAGEGVKAAQRIRDAVPRILEKIRHILHQPAVFLQFLEKYEVGEVLGAVKNELFNLLAQLPAAPLCWIPEVWYRRSGADR